MKARILNRDWQVAVSLKEYELRTWTLVERIYRLSKKEH